MNLDNWLKSPNSGLNRESALDGETMANPDYAPASASIMNLLIVCCSAA